MAEIKDLPSLPQALPSGSQKVSVWNTESGEEFVRWPIDAREMVSSGEYSFASPGSDPVETKSQEVDPVPHVKAAKASLKDVVPGAPANVSTKGKMVKSPTRKSRAKTEAGKK